MRAAVALACALACILVGEGCGREVTACDIRTADCQDATFYAVLAVRNEPWDAWAVPPPMRVISQDEFRDELLASVGPSGPSPWDPVLQLLGMLPAGGSLASSSIDEQVQNIAAYYALETRDITIIDHGTTDDLIDTTQTLAHELVHAVQDRYGSLAVQDKNTSDDEMFARHAVSEGEATLYSRLVRLQIEGRGFTEFNWEGYYDGMLDTVLTMVIESPSRLQAALQYLIYPLGGKLVTDAYTGGGTPAVAALFASPPNSALAVMQGYGHEPHLAAMNCEPPIPAGYDALGMASLGVPGMIALLTTSYGGLIDAWSLAAAWRGDALYVAQSSDGAQTAVAWRLRLESAAAADALAGAASLPPGLATHVFGNEVLLIGATDPAILTTWDVQGCQ